MDINYYLIASEKNDYRPWITSLSALAVFCVVIWGLRLLLPISLSLAAPGIDASDLMQQVNFERTGRFVPALIINSKLNEAANVKSSDMLTRHYFGHVNPDGNYVWPVIEATGYTPYLTLGENLAMDFFSASAVVEAWMNSPTHRANILNQKFQDQGLASIFGNFEVGYDSIMITNLFGTLLKKASPPPPPPAAKITPPPAVAKTTPKPTPVVEVPPKTIVINPDIKITKKTIGNDAVVELDVIVAGGPTKVTATISDKTVELLPSAITGQHLGVFTFPATTDFTDSKLTIEASDVSGQKSSAEFKLSKLQEPLLPEVSPKGNIPVSSESAFLHVIKAIFSVFALLYVIFLVIDSIIIHRTKIKRTNIHSSPHALLFLLIAVVNLLAVWF